MPALNKEIASQLRQALVNNGYKEPQISMLMAQAAHESMGFNKKPAIENNNFGGVKYRKSLSGIAAPSNNYFAPSKEDKKRTPYAHFKNMDDFVKNWIPYAHLNGMRYENNIGAPLDAKNLADYAHRLKLNHYYQDTEVNYLKGLLNWNVVLQELETPDKNVSIQTLPDNLRNAEISYQRDQDDITQKTSAKIDDNRFQHFAGRLTGIVAGKVKALNLMPNPRENASQKTQDTLITETADTGGVIDINLDKPMITHLTIDARDIKEGINNFKLKVDEVFQEVLSAADGR
jgi:hypothetical protein